MKIIIWL